MVERKRAVKTKIALSKAHTQKPKNLLKAANYLYNVDAEKLHNKKPEDVSAPELKVIVKADKRARRIAKAARKNKIYWPLKMKKHLKIGPYQAYEIAHEEVEKLLERRPNAEDTITEIDIRKLAQNLRNKA